MLFISTKPKEKFVGLVHLICAATVVASSAIEIPSSPLGPSMFVRMSPTKKLVAPRKSIAALMSTVVSADSSLSTHKSDASNISKPAENLRDPIKPGIYGGTSVIQNSRLVSRYSFQCFEPSLMHTGDLNFPSLQDF